MYVNQTKNHLSKWLCASTYCVCCKSLHLSYVHIYKRAHSFHRLLVPKQYALEVVGLKPFVLHFSW